MNSEVPGTSKSLELLGNLVEALRDFRNRENGLKKDELLKRHHIDTGHSEGYEAADAGYHGGIAAEQKRYEEEGLALQHRHDARAAWLDRAVAAAREGVANEVAAKEGAEAYLLQKSTFQGGRDRDQGHARVDAQHRSALDTLEKNKRSLKIVTRRARGAFSGYGSAKSELKAALNGGADIQVPESGDELIKGVHNQLKSAASGLKDLPALQSALFGTFPPLLLIPLILIVPALISFLLQIGNILGFTYLHAAMVSGAGLLVVGAIYFLGRSKVISGAPRIASAIGNANRLLEAGEGVLDTERDRLHGEIEDNHEQLVRDSKDKYDLGLSEVEQLKASRPRVVERKAERVLAKFESIRKREREEFEEAHRIAMSAFDVDVAEEKRRLEIARSKALVDFDKDHIAAWEKLSNDWKSQAEPLYFALLEARQNATDYFPAWTSAEMESWRPPKDFAHVVKYGQLAVDLGEIVEELPEDDRLMLPGIPQMKIPLSLDFPMGGSLLLETGDGQRSAAIETLNQIILRLLSMIPPGKVSFTIVDPVGLGENFAGLMHLADYEDAIISSRIWTQPNQIEQRLSELNEHMEKVIQMYLRTEYETIVEYNKEAGTIAEKYHFLVVADFPNGFSDVAAKRLMSIASSGARCGVFSLIHWDTRHDLPQQLVASDLRSTSTRIAEKDGGLVLADPRAAGGTLTLERAPDPRFTGEFLKKVGESSLDSGRVEVPFEHVAPPQGQVWSGDSTSILTVPIGRTGATKLQELAIGKGTCQHALIAGKTGSGKSTLFHVMITNLALWYSPEQVEFYLVDFKKGVEFKAYATANLPHAKVIAIESDREFGLSVLQRLDDELRSRGDRFRKLGAQDLAGFKKAGGGDVPRTLLLIDEFQELFTEEDRIAQNATVLLDRIVRQGRAFGIHVILGSQTLGGAFTLARTTLVQMAIRIALQCNEADAYLIMDDSNPAPRMLTRPGEGIYNDMAGMMEGNSPFQVVWLDDDERDAQLARVTLERNQAGRRFSNPIVFEGNVPADVEENEELAAALSGNADSKGHSVDLWLGAPNSIKGPTKATIQRQSGNHVLVVGQRDEAAQAIVGVGALGVAAQLRGTGGEVIVLDSSAPGTPEADFFERALNGTRDKVRLARGGEIPEVIEGLAKEMVARAADDSLASSAPPKYLFVHGLQKFKKLRHEDDFSFSMDDDDAAPDPGKLFNELITDGPALGIHIIATCDSYNNVSRALSRKALTEFEMRIVFQMSANDSANLIESSAAATLGMNRALFYNEQEGYLETFRPYALPDERWLEKIR